MDEPDNLIGVLDDVAWGSKCDQSIAAFRKINQTKPGNLFQQLLGRIDERKVEALDLVPVLAQFRLKPLDDEARTAMNERHKRRGEDDLHAAGAVVQRTLELSARTTRSMSCVVSRAWVGRLIPRAEHSSAFGN